MVFKFNYDWIDKRIVAASLPTSIKDIELLYQEGVRTIVSLCDGIDVKRYIKKSNLDIKHIIFEIPDFSVPNEHQVREFLEFMDNNNGEAVAIHCYAGVGRTGTLIALYLINRGMTAEQAIAYVRSRRRGSVESRIQEQFLYSAEKAVKQ